MYVQAWFFFGVVVMLAEGHTLSFVLSVILVAIWLHPIVSSSVAAWSLVPNIFPHPLSCCFIHALASMSFHLTHTTLFVVCNRCSVMRIQFCVLSGPFLRCHFSLHTHAHTRTPHTHTCVCHPPYLHVSVWRLSRNLSFFAVSRNLHFGLLSCFWSLSIGLLVECSFTPQLVSFVLSFVRPGYALVAFCDLCVGSRLSIMLLSSFLLSFQAPTLHCISWPSRPVVYALCALVVASSLELAPSMLPLPPCACLFYLPRYAYSYTHAWLDFVCHVSFVCLRFCISSLSVLVGHFLLLFIGAPVVVPYRIAWLLTYSFSRMTAFSVWLRSGHIFCLFDRRNFLLLACN